METHDFSSEFMQQMHSLLSELNQINGENQTSVTEIRTKLTEVQTLLLQPTLVDESSTLTVTVTPTPTPTPTPAPLPPQPKETAVEPFFITLKEYETAFSEAIRKFKDYKERVEQERIQQKQASAEQQHRIQVLERQLHYQHTQFHHQVEWTKAQVKDILNQTEHEAMELQSWMLTKCLEVHDLKKMKR